MDNLSKLITIIIGSVIGFTVFAGVVYLTIQSHKKVESKQKNKDLFNILLGLPFFVFFLIGPFILETEWTGNFYLNLIAYMLLVIINGGFFLFISIRGYIGVFWGLIVGALCVGFLGKIASLAFG